MTDYMEESLDVSLDKILPTVHEGIAKRTTYFGVPAVKSPMDAWVYQELIYETRPEVIIEIGNKFGGSTLFLAHLCDTIGKGRVIGLDLSHRNVPKHVKHHPRITLIEGDACQSFEHVDQLISEDERVLVIEDSSHTYDNTLNLLRLYSKFIKPDDYFIVEDSICHHGLKIGPNPGPYEAIEAFVSENPDFEIDRSREHFFLTWNPKGYLKRTALNGEHTSMKQPKRWHPNTVKQSSVRDTLKLFVPPILNLLVKKLTSVK